VESSDEWAPRIAAALAADVMSFDSPNGGASFVVKKDSLPAIAQFSGVATFIPVPTRTVVRTSTAAIAVAACMHGDLQRHGQTCV
jgi:hypothetical protein